MITVDNKLIVALCFSHQCDVSSAWLRFARNEECRSTHLFSAVRALSVAKASHILHAGVSCSRPCGRRWARHYVACVLQTALNVFGRVGVGKVECSLFGYIGRRARAVHEAIEG